MQYCESFDGKEVDYFINEPFHIITTIVVIIVDTIIIITTIMHACDGRGPSPLTELLQQRLAALHPQPERAVRGPPVAGGGAGLTQRVLPGHGRQPPADRRGAR